MSDKHINGSLYHSETAWQNPLFFALSHSQVLVLIISKMIAESNGKSLKIRPFLPFQIWCTTAIPTRWITFLEWLKGIGFDASLSSQQEVREIQRRWPSTASHLVVPLKRVCHYYQHKFNNAISLGSHIKIYYKD